jgi:hypothetical protein
MKEATHRKTNATGSHLYVESIKDGLIESESRMMVTQAGVG